MSQEEIELQDIRHNETPPVGCSSRNSVSDTRDDQLLAAGASCSSDHLADRRRKSERPGSTFGTESAKYYF